MISSVSFISEILLINGDFRVLKLCSFVLLLGFVNSGKRIRFSSFTVLGYLYDEISLRVWFYIN